LSYVKAVDTEEVQSATALPTATCGTSYAVHLGGGAVAQCLVLNRRHTDFQSERQARKCLWVND